MPDYDDEYLHEIECVEESVRAEERENLRKQSTGWQKSWFDMLMLALGIFSCLTTGK